MTVRFRRLALSFALAVVAALRASPAQGQEPPAAPVGATARCRDGTYSFSKHRSGTCSHHGGVASWLNAGGTPTAPASDTLGQGTRGEFLTCGAGCGVERWAVKTLSDPDRQRVQLRPVDATIEALVALQRPLVLSPVARAEPVEMTVYRVEA